MNTTIERFAIRSKVTGYFLPNTTKNHTEAEPQPNCVPRFFVSRASANSALSRWAEGVWHLSWSYSSYDGDYESELSPVMPEGGERNRKDMEVVSVRISLEIIG